MPSDGDQCLAVNDCISNPCLNGGTCNEVYPTGYNCTCPTGYTDTLCQEKEPQQKQNGKCIRVHLHNTPSGGGGGGGVGGWNTPSPFDSRFFFFALACQRGRSCARIPVPLIWKIDSPLTLTFSGLVWHHGQHSIIVKHLTWKKYISCVRHYLWLLFG